MSHMQTGQKLSAGTYNADVHQGIQRIEEKSLESDQTMVTFSSIPQTYQSLWLFMSAGVSGTTPRVAVVRFNGDSGTNYASHRMQHLGDGTSATDYLNPESFIAIGIINTNLLAQNSIYFPGYARTDRNKSSLSSFSAPSSTSASDSLLGFCGGEWRSSSAITDIEIFEQPTGGQDPILAGSIFTLYGLGGPGS